MSKKKSILAIAVFLFSVSLLSCVSSKKYSPLTEGQGACEIGIVGGGPAGLYLAYRLGPKFHEQVCLFEKEAELGGRIHDERRSGDASWVGTGARRVNEAQLFVLKLGKELGIEFQTPEHRSQLIHHRGHFGYSVEDFVRYYPKLIGPLDQDSSTTREDEIYSLLITAENRAKALRYPTLKKYITAVAGKDGFRFLRGMSRFHGDFDYEISAPNYLDYLQEELKTSSVNLYPVGGMSAFIRKMESAAIAQRVRIFKAEPVIEVSEVENGHHYRLQTPLRSVRVQRLVFATPPVGLDKIKGPLVERIREAPEYQALLPVKIVVINQWWKEPWWKTAKAWRAWSTDQCVNHVEIPQEAYLATEKVTRSVYTDDPVCARYWEETLERGGIAAVENKVVQGLSKIFSYPQRMEISKPIKTSMQVWPGGWYYIRAGSRVSNRQISSWAIQPLADHKNLMMVGEAYWPNRPGWSEGAYFSANALIEARFGTP